MPLSMFPEDRLLNKFRNVSEWLITGDNDVKSHSEIGSRSVLVCQWWIIYMSKTIFHGVIGQQRDIYIYTHTFVNVYVYIIKYIYIWFHGYIYIYIYKSIHRGFQNDGIRLFFWPDGFHRFTAKDSRSSSIRSAFLGAGRVSRRETTVMGHDGILIEIYTDKIWENPMCIYIYTHLYLFIYLSICLSIYLPTYLSIYLSLSLSCRHWFSYVSIW